MKAAQNDNDSQRPTRNPELAARSVTQIFDDCIDQKKTPTLWKLLQGDDSGPLRSELMGMIRSFVPHRSPRERVKVIAKLVREVNGAEVESPVVIRDISASGAQIAVSTRLGLSATDLTDVRLRLRLPEIEDCVVHARLARVAHSDENFIQGGFQFVGLPEEVGRALHTIQHAHNQRTSEIAHERLSRAAPETRGSVELEPPRRALGPRLK